MRETNRNVRAAITAHTNLNVFAAVVAILEGGVIYGGDNAAARKIIAICKKEQERQLAKFDAALIRLEPSLASSRPRPMEQQPDGTVTAVDPVDLTPRLSDPQVRAWAERYDLRNSLSELRAMADDARTLEGAA